MMKVASHSFDMPGLGPGMSIVDEAVYYWLDKDRTRCIACWDQSPADPFQQ
jgi:hypothetical protein